MSVRYEDEYSEWKEELAMEGAEDELHLEKLHRDYDYAMEEAGILDAHDMISDIVKTMSMNDHDVTFSDVLDYLRDM